MTASGHVETENPYVLNFDKTSVIASIPQSTRGRF